MPCISLTLASRVVLLYLRDRVVNTTLSVGVLRLSNTSSALEYPQSCIKEVWSPPEGSNM